MHGFHNAAVAVLQMQEKEREHAKVLKSRDAESAKQINELAALLEAHEQETEETFFFLFLFFFFFFSFIICIFFPLLLLHNFHSFVHFAQAMMHAKDQETQEVVLKRERELGELLLGKEQVTVPSLCHQLCHHCTCHHCSNHCAGAL